MNTIKALVNMLLYYNNTPHFYYDTEVLLHQLF